ncbi:MAG: hypothetical protein ACYS7Y_35775 [Planctomycetota bacterium]|jgi:hypothetical protein
MTRNPFFWWICGAAVGFCLATVACGAEPPDYPRDDSVNFAEWRRSRPDFKTGFGEVVDDVESMSDGLDGRGRPHPMKNAADPGNWVHEMTHLLNGRFRNVVMKMKGKVTLRQVANCIPQEQRKFEIWEYMQVMPRYWNEQPLYVLDESVAAQNALYYQVTAKKVDLKRESMVLEWAYYSNAIITAVKKHDPGYDNLDKLVAYINWQNHRANYLVALHMHLRKPDFPAPSPKPYQIW